MAEIKDNICIVLAKDNSKVLRYDVKVMIFNYRTFASYEPYSTVLSEQLL
jgi:hypothetical protein